MTKRLAALSWLTVMWVAFWGHVTAANVLGGLSVGVLLLVAFPVHQPLKGRGRIRPLRLLRFLGYFAVKLVQANVQVAWEVVTPRNWRLNEGIVAVPLRSASGSTLAFLANTISLTPGTLVIEVQSRPPILYVHVLQLRSAEEVRQNVLRLEWLLTRARGTEEPAPEVAPAAAPKEMATR